MATTDTTKPGVSDDKNKSADEHIKDQGPLDRDNDIGDIVKNAKVTRRLEAAGVDINNPMEVNLAMEKINNGEDPNPNAGKQDPDEEGGDLNLPDDPKPAEPKMVMVKINGAERKVLQSEVDAEGGIVPYQKAHSADEKMRKNASEKKGLDERERKLAERELALSHQEQAQLSNPNNTDQLSNDAGTVSKEALALKDKMYSGDESKAGEAIQELLDVSKGTTQTIDTQAIVEQAAEKVQWQNNLVSAKAMFSSEYKEIESNPEYRGYADQATIRIMAENKDWTPTQIIREAGEQARLKFRDQLQEKEAQDELKAGDEERLNNKRTTDNVKGNDAKVQKKPTKKPLTQSEIVANMQKDRSHASA